MTDARQPRDLQTRPLTPPEVRAVIHAVAMLDRSVDSFQPQEIRRAALLDTLDDLNARMKADAGLPVRALLLGGQTSLLEDVAVIRDDMLALLAILNARGRLGFGPWYTLVDDTLVSGEALIRNLLAARADSRRYGLRLMSLAYLPRSSGHAAQLPQILRGFKLNVALLADPGGPFNEVGHVVHWEAPGDNRVQVIPLPGERGWPHSPITAEQVAQDIQHQRRPSQGPVLWLYDINASTDLPADFAAQVRARTGLELVAGEMDDYLSDWRVALIGADQPTHRGPIQRGQQHGLVSARLHLKQDNARMQAYLVHHVEPWLAIALTHGQPAHAKNLLPLLDHTWRLLLRNQSAEALSGATTDSAQQEIEARSQQIEDAGRELVARALAALPGTPHRTDAPLPTETLHLVVWNGHNWPAQQVVEVALALPPDRHPARLLDPDGTEALFAWEASADGGRLVFSAQAPALGYAAYTLHLHDGPPPPTCAISRVTGDHISTVHGDRLSVADGALHWTSGAHDIADLLRFFDGGDAGDIFDYSAPQPDVVEQARLTGDVEVESCPLYERLILRHRLRVAPELRPDGSRARGVRLIELLTTATCYDHQPGVFLRTTFDNTASDHRLRAHLRTGIQADEVQVGAPFSVDSHPVAADTPLLTMQRFAAVPHADSGLTALLTRGLPEVQALPEDGQTTLALTLLRAVGWLARPDLPHRQIPPAPPLPTLAAQCLRPVAAEYALVTAPSLPAVLRTAAVYDAPLRVHIYDEAPSPARRSYLSVVSDRASGADSDGEGVILTALKPPQQERGWLARLWNPHAQPVEVWLTPHERPRAVRLVSLAEEPERPLYPDANGCASLRLNPHEIVTVQIVFEG